MKKRFLQITAVLLLLALLATGVSAAPPTSEGPEPSQPVTTDAPAEPSGPISSEEPIVSDEPVVSEDPAPDVSTDPEPEESSDPEPEITAEPDPGVTEDPEPEITAEPDPEVTEDPEPEVTEEPDPEVTEPPTPPEEPDLPAYNPAVAQKIIRIGLRYGDDVMDGANIDYGVGAGLYLGYYDSANKFIPIAAYTGGKTLSVVKTENVYYGTYNGYASYYDHLTSSSVVVGCYHLQLSGSYSSYESAYAVASQYTGGFVACIGGAYYARIGNYAKRDAAVVAQDQYAMSGIYTELKGTSSYGLSVVVRGTNTIVFQYDDLGHGSGLGIQPIPNANGAKSTCLFIMGDNNEWYGGFRYERIDGGDLTIVNMVQLDDYLKGVVPHEMSNSWPIEALKAQAVTARSYSLTMLNKHNKKYHFDLCYTTCCQAYSGLNRAGSNSDRAVDETCGIIATYNGQPAYCFYHASNGGATENSSVVWNSQQETYPYLIGVVDPFEATVEGSISGYRWIRQYTGAELAKLLQSKGWTNCSEIRSAKVSTYTETGNPLSVTFIDSNEKTYRLTAKQMMKVFSFRSWRYDFVYDQVNTVVINDGTVVEKLAGLYAIDGNGNLTMMESEACYVINGSGDVVRFETGSTVSGDVFTISGAGWGHNVGMSQQGARAMALLGFTYKDIIEFYYTGVTVG